ncbi:MAG: hypothetical protein PHW63_03325 [Alphaproteobacteria bacterium]|nr:hypothetical protein [Alphaproteobacteria bacterium]
MESRSQTVNRSRWAAFLCLLFFVFSLSVLSSAPASASPLRDGDIVMNVKAIGEELTNWATTLAKMVQETAAYKFVTATWTTMTTFLNTAMDKLGIQRTTDDKAMLAAKQIAFEGDKRFTTYVADAKTKNILTKEQMRRAADPAPGLPSDQFLCNVLMARKAPLELVKFARMFSAVIQRGVDAAYRGPWSNGDGPEYYDDFERSHAEMANMVDGYNLNTEEATNLPDVSSSTDMDSSVDAISRDRTYIVPPAKLVDRTMNGQAVKVMTFEPDKTSERDWAAQDRWVKATRLCYTLAGPRPSPPPINARDSEASRRKRAKYDSCRARQNAFIKQCSDRVAVLTRPNCDLDEMKPFCEVALDACEAANDAQIELEPSYNDCRNGLSLYEFEKISNMMCGSTRRFQSEGFAAASHDEQIRVLGVCGHLMSKWQERIDMEDEAFDLAVRGMRDIRECYNGVE